MPGSGGRDGGEAWREVSPMGGWADSAALCRGTSGVIIRCGTRLEAVQDESWMERVVGGGEEIETRPHTPLLSST